MPLPEDWLEEIVKSIPVIENPIVVESPPFAGQGWGNENWLESELCHTPLPGMKEKEYVSPLNS